MKQTVLSLLVDNNPGVLARVSSLFSRRGYNIDSVSAGNTHDSEYTRITVVVRGDDQIIEQIRNQILKLEDVKKVTVLHGDSSVTRELLLVKVLADKREKQDIFSIVDVFRAKVVDVANDSMIIELTGTSQKLDAFLGLLSEYDVLEMVRTGLTGLERGVKTLR